MWQKVTLVQPCSLAAMPVPASVFAFPLHPLSPAAAHPARTPTSGTSLLLLNLQPTSAHSHLLSHPLAALAMSWSCRKDPHNPSDTHVHKHPLHPRGAEVTWSLLSGSKGPLWPLLQLVLVGHVLGHHSG